MLHLFYIRLFFLTFYLSKNAEKSVTISTKILSSTAGLNFDNNTKCAQNQHIRMISRLMTAENSALTSQELITFKNI